MKKQSKRNMFVAKWQLAKNLQLKAALTLLVCACSVSNPKSSETGKIGSASNQTLVKESLASPFSIRINLTTNRLSYLNSGVVIAQWNIATGDVTGAAHDGRPQFTPPGVYTVDEFVRCPQWMPRSPIDPKTGKEASDDATRFQIFRENPSLYGACGASNPLGKYVLWFSGPYGLHGNANESVLKRANADARRVSGGCVRNPNEKIEWLFHDILVKSKTYEGFSKKVKALAEEGNKNTLSGNVSKLGVRVVIDYFERDLKVGESVLQSTLTPNVQNKRIPVVTPVTTALAVNEQAKAKLPKVAEKFLPTDGQGDIKVCKVVYVERDGSAKVYANLTDRKADYLRQITMGSDEKVYGLAGDWYKLIDGYVLKSRLGECK